MADIHIPVATQTLPIDPTLHLPTSPNFTQEPNTWPDWDQDPRDPRWLGSTKLVHEVAMEHSTAYFRALRDGQGNIYLLWHQTAALSIPNNQNTDCVWFGVWVGQGSNTAYGRVFRCKPFLNDGVDRFNRLVDIVESYVWNGTGWVYDTPPPNVKSFRDHSAGWVCRQGTKSYCHATTGQWAYALKLDGGEGGIPLPNAGQELRLWFCMETTVEETIGTSTGNVKLAPFNWPPDAALTRQGADPVLPGIERWGKVYLDNAGLGVSIAASDVHIQRDDGTIGEELDVRKYTSANGSDYVNRNRLNNIFYAKVKNGGALPSGQIKATFRLADWGASPNLNAFRDAHWTFVTERSMAAIPAGGDLVFTGEWPESSWLENYAKYPPLGSERSQHQCVLVELTGDTTNVPISVDSAFRNMMFKLASLQEQPAVINVRGLGPDPAGTSHRSVYLLVRAANMPATEYDEPRRRAFQKLLWENRGVLPEMAVSSGSMGDIEPITDSAFQRLRDFVPTCEIYAFYETGRTYVSDGRTVDELAPMASFGMFLNHDGTLHGWDYQLVGAELVAPNFWKLRVPNESKAVVGVRVLAKETPGATLDHSTDSRGVNFSQACLYARGRLAIADRVKVKNVIGGGYAPIVNAGNVETNIGVEAQVGDVYSAAKVFVRNRGHINGKLFSSQQPDIQSGGVVAGPTAPVSSVHLASLAIVAPTPPTNQGAVIVNASSQRTLNAGAYGGVTVNSQGTLVLSGSHYVFESFGVEAQARVLVDCAAGPVIINVRGDCHVRGDFVEKNGRALNVVLLCFGTNTVSIGRPFTGTIVAPNATLDLATVPAPGYTGSFFAANINVQPDSVINWIPFGGNPILGF